MLVKLDENLPLQLKGLFTEAGHDAETVVDEGLPGAQDSMLASVCLAEERALVTHDLGFSDIRMYPPAQYPGIIVFRLTNQTRDYILEIGERLIARLARSSPKGQTWIVEDFRVRIRE